VALGVHVLSRRERLERDLIEMRWRMQHPVLKHNPRKFAVCRYCDRRSARVIGTSPKGRKMYVCTKDGCNERFTADPPILTDWRMYANSKGGVSDPNYLGLRPDIYSVYKADVLRLRSRPASRSAA
jgi:hypothetical protein